MGDGLGGVVTRPVEPAIHRLLDAPSHGLEQRRDQDGRGDHSQAVGRDDRREERLQHEDGTREDRREDGRNRGVGHGPADDPVDLVQAISQDRDADAHREQGYAGKRQLVGRKGEDDDDAGQDEGEPLDLASLDEIAAPEAGYGGGKGEEDRDQEQRSRGEPEAIDDRRERRHGDRVVDRVDVRQRPGPEGDARGGEDRDDPVRGDDPPAP